MELPVRGVAGRDSPGWLVAEIGLRGSGTPVFEDVVVLLPLIHSLTAEGRPLLYRNAAAPITAAALKPATQGARRIFGLSPTGRAESRADGWVLKRDPAAGSEGRRGASGGRSLGACGSTCDCSGAVGWVRWRGLTKAAGVSGDEAPGSVSATTVCVAGMVSARGIA